MRILIAAGGTGGHIYPGLTIADAIRSRYSDAEIVFVGSDRGLEGELVPRHGYRLEQIPSAYLERKLSLAVVRTAWRSGRGTLAAVSLLRQFAPDLVVGTGGYVTGPVLLGAALLRKKILIQEQNAYPGITNRLVARWASGLALGYGEAAALLRCRGFVEVTGNPIRSDVTSVTRLEGARRLGLDSARRTLIITGGSQGARSINQAVEGASAQLKELKGWQIVHATGKRHFGSIAERVYHVNPATNERIVDGNMVIVPYIHDMPAAYGCADLMVSRAGALSIAETTARGVAAIYVPFPYASEDHQRKNAEVMVKAKAAVMILDAELTKERLWSEISSLAEDSARLNAMAQAAKNMGKPDAVKRIVGLVERLIQHP